HEDAHCDRYPCDGDRLARAAATRAIGAAARLPVRLLQRLPSAGLVPHRRVVSFGQLTGLEGADECPPLCIRAADNFAGGPARYWGQARRFESTAGGRSGGTGGGGVPQG